MQDEKQEYLVRITTYHESSRPVLQEIEYVCWLLFNAKIARSEGDFARSDRIRKVLSKYVKFDGTSAYQPYLAYSIEEAA